ncbi:MAG: hypothetical protein LBW77_06485, partial [Verrucomicrobiota bacterium]|nr:hypothetical protein [Verrucomicrobiota bacterium]
MAYFWHHPNLCPTSQPIFQITHHFIALSLSPFSFSDLPPAQSVSQNIVGYVSTGVATGTTLFAPPFITVGSQTAVSDLDSIKIDGISDFDL